MNNNVPTWSDYERLFATRYHAGGHTREMALYFAQGAIRAILAGNYWTHGKPVDPDDSSL